MATRKVLNTLSVLLPNGKVAQTTTETVQYTARGGIIGTLYVKVDGKVATDTLGVIDKSSHPDYNYVFTPSNELYNNGLRAVRGSLADVRAAVVSAGGYRLGISIQAMKARGA